MMPQTKEVGSKDLSASGLLVLLNPNVEAREALKVGFKELVAMGLVHLGKNSQRSRIGLQATQIHLWLEPGERPKNLILRGLLGDLRSAARHGNEFAKMLQQLQREYGHAYTKFKLKIVLPGLLRQGLLEPQQHKVMGLFNTIRYRHTAAGLAQKERLEHDMARAHQISRLLKDDPTQVAALVASLGAAIILIPELRPYFGQINELMRKQSDEAFIYYFGEVYDEKHPAEARFDDLEQAFSDVDSGFSSADSGGDGGGE